MLYPKDPAVQVERTLDSITIAWRRKPGESWFWMICGSLPLLACIPIATLPSGTGEPTPIGVIVFVFLFFGSLAIPALYYGLVLLLNHTVITADRGRIRRSGGPLWTGRKVDLPSQGVKQFFTGTSTIAAGSSTGIAGRSIFLLDGDDHTYNLVTTMPSTFAANQVRHELNDFFGLEDLPIYGVTTDPSHPGPRPT